MFLVFNINYLEINTYLLLSRNKRGQVNLFNIQREKQQQQNQSTVKLSQLQSLQTTSNFVVFHQVLFPCLPPLEQGDH